MYVLTQKRDPYIKLFNISSERKTDVLNIATVKYSMQASGKPYYTEMMIHTLFTIYTLRPTYWISSKQGDRHIKTFSTLSGLRRVFLISLQLDILCTSAVKRYCLKRQFTMCVSPVFNALELMKARKTFHRVVRTSFWSVHYSGELLAIKTVSSRLPRRGLKRVLLHCSVG